MGCGCVVGRGKNLQFRPLKHQLWRDINLVKEAPQPDLNPVLRAAGYPPHQHLALERPKHNHPKRDVHVRAALVHDALPGLEKVVQRDAEPRAGNHPVGVLCVDPVFDGGAGRRFEGGWREGDEVREGGLEADRLDGSRHCGGTGTN